MNELVNFREIKEFKGKTNSDIVNMPVNLRQKFLKISENKILKNAPITSMRILFKILNDLSDEQFVKSNPKQFKQISLFDQDFLTEHNSYARLTFKITEIADRKDYKNVKKGLVFLENLNKGWYKSLNSKGKVISSYGGLITNSNISEGKVTFLINSFWLEKFLNIKPYNQIFF